MIQKLFAGFCISVVLIFSQSIKADEASIKAKEIISAQVSLLKAGDLEKLKACFTERQKFRITKDSLRKGQEEITKYAIDDLVESAFFGEYGGEKTLKIKMKNGRTLTTLVFRKEKWLADTIWFK